MEKTLPELVVHSPSGEVETVLLPVVATLTWIGASQTLSNAAVVPTGGSSINIHASQATHVILDVNGYYAGAGKGNLNTFWVCSRATSR